MEEEEEGDVGEEEAPHDTDTYICELSVKEEAAGFAVHVDATGVTVVEPLPEHVPSLYFVVLRLLAEQLYK